MTHPVQKPIYFKSFLFVVELETLSDNRNSFSFLSKWTISVSRIFCGL